MVFIARETLPLFRSAHTKPVAKLKLPATGNLFLDETGQAAMVLDPKEGLLTYALPKGDALSPLVEGPTRPWKLSTPPDGRGAFAVVGSDDKLTLGCYLARRAFRWPILIRTPERPRHQCGRSGGRHHTQGAGSHR
jgi:hypothetical protein